MQENLKPGCVQQLFDLSDRVAIVTGGSGHLGFSMAWALADLGASVIVTSRDLDRATETAGRLPCPNAQHHQGIALDQLNPASIEAAFETLMSAVPHVDVLVNNALAPLGKDWRDVSMAEFARHQENNASYFELSRRVRDLAVANRRSASIINVGSMYGQVASYPQAYEGIGAASPVAYHALKGGTIHMTRHLAAYWAADQVRVNCLSPGPFPNPAKAPAELIDRLKQFVPMGRMGKPEELMGAVAFLASDASSYMTGQNLTIDGGWTAW